MEAFDWNGWNDRMVELAEKFAETPRDGGKAERAAILAHIYAGKAEILRGAEKKPEDSPQ